MDVMKAGLSREAMLGFFLFLLAERHRHQEDIDMINEKLNSLTNQLNITDTEKVNLVKESLKYVKL